MDAGDIIIRVVVGVVFVSIFFGIFWAIRRAERRDRDRVESFVRQHYEPRGFAVELTGATFFEAAWSVSASGELRGHRIVIRWGSYPGGGTSGSPKQKWTDVLVAAPALPADFGLEVGVTKRLVTDDPAYRLVTGEPTFDATFRGWTDHAALVPHLLTARVRQGLLALRALPDVELSALRGKYLRVTDRRGIGTSAVRIRTATRRWSHPQVASCLDAATLDAMVAVGADFADAAGAIRASGKVPS